MEVIRDTMFLDIQTVKEPVYDWDMDDDMQPVPIRVEARLNTMSVDATISPENGWSLERQHKEALRRSGVRSIGPLIIISDMLKVADTLVLYDFKRVNFLMERWRLLLGRDTHWLRKIQVVDIKQKMKPVVKVQELSLLGSTEYRAPTMREINICLGIAEDRDIGVSAVQKAYEQMDMLDLL